MYTQTRLTKDLTKKRIESVTGPTKAGFQDTPSRFEKQCFPWPQYYESNDETGELVLTYPGASGSLSKVNFKIICYWLYVI